MKKVLALGMIAALSMGAMACGESDSCVEPTALTLMRDLNAFKANQKDLATEFGEGNLEAAVQPCEAFGTALKDFVEKNKGINKESMDAEWREMKKSSVLCWTNVTVNMLLEATNYPKTYAALQSNVDYCTTLVAGGIAVGSEVIGGMGETFSTVGGWHGVLQAAADATDPNKTKE